MNGENGGINDSGGAGRGEAQKDTIKDNNTSEDEPVTQKSSARELKQIVDVGDRHGMHD